MAVRRQGCEVIERVGCWQTDEHATCVAEDSALSTVYPLLTLFFPVQLMSLFFSVRGFKLDANASSTLCCSRTNVQRRSFPLWTLPPSLVEAFTGYIFAMGVSTDRPHDSELHRRHAHPRSRGSGSNFQDYGNWSPCGLTCLSKAWRFGRCKKCQNALC